MYYLSIIKKWYWPIKTLKRIKFNSKGQMVLCVGFFFVCFGFAFFFLSFNILTCEDLASFWVYSFSICFSLLLAWKTHEHEHTHTHTRWPVSLVSLPHAYHQAAGPAASCAALLGQPENHRAWLWSHANYSSLKKQKAKEKKKSPANYETNTDFRGEKEKARRGGRNRLSKSARLRR